MGKKKFNTVKAMAWFIIIVMTFSIMGYVGSSFFDDSGIVPENYNNIDFFNTSNSWTANIGGRVYAFQNYPGTLESLTLPIDPINWLGTEKIYLGYKPKGEFNVQQQLVLLSTIFQSNNVRPQLACTVEKDCPDIPIINCEKNGLILKQSDISKISKQDNCLVLSAPDTSELQKLTERLIYRLLGVMQ